MVDLTDYGVDTRPKVVKRKRLELGARSVGHICRRERDDKVCYVSVREASEHRYHGEDPWYDLPFDGDAYGLSVELFSHLHAAGVGPVYIAEEDTGSVLQFSYMQFVKGDGINFEDDDEDRGWEKDPQMVVPVESAVDSWEDHFPGIFAVQPAFR